MREKARKTYRITLPVQVNDLNLRANNGMGATRRNEKVMAIPDKNQGLNTIGLSTGDT